MSDGASLALIAVAGTGTLGHLVWGDPQGPSKSKAVIKALAVAGLAGLAMLNSAPWLLVLGLALSVAGDVFMVWDREERWLLPGMAAFFLAHCAYVALFILNGDGVPDTGLSVAFVAAGLAMFLWLRSGLGRMFWPVAGYTLIIVSMGVAATTLQGPMRVALSGAALFMLSDALLAGNLFRIPQGHAARHYTSPAIWLTYVLAQALIMIAFVPDVLG